MPGAPGAGEPAKTVPGLWHQKLCTLRERNLVPLYTASCLWRELQKQINKNIKRIHNLENSEKMPAMKNALSNMFDHLNLRKVFCGIDLLTALSSHFQSPLLLSVFRLKNKLYIFAMLSYFVPPFKTAYCLFCRPVKLTRQSLNFLLLFAHKGY